MRKTISTVLLLLGLFGAAGADWTSIGPHGGPIYCGAVAPSTPPAIYVASTNTSYPLLRSTDNGASWATYGATLTNYPRVLAVHPADPNTLYGLVSSIFYRTTNGGTNWTQTSLGSNTYGNDIAINPQNPQVIYVACYKYDGAAWKPTAVKSTNGGTNWTMTPLDTLTSSTMYACAIDPVDTNVVYMGGAVNSQTVVYKSTDCGATWTKAIFPAYYYYVYSLLVSPADHNIVFAGTLYGICRSTDAGQTWVRQSTNNYNYRLACAPGNPDVMYSAAYTSLYRSTDAGITWAIAGTGLRGTTVRTVLTVPGDSLSVYCGSTAGMFKSTNRGTNWTEANNGITMGKIPVVAVNPHQPATVHCEFIDNETFKTTDDGLTWLPQGTPLSCGNVCNIAFDLHDPQRLWMFEASG